MVDYLVLQGERKISMLAGITLVFMIHVFGVYWWYKNDDLLYPLVLLPPKEIPPFWHAIFIIMVNGMNPTIMFLLIIYISVFKLATSCAKAVVLIYIL